MRSQDHFSYLFARKSLHEEREGGDISECLVHLLTAKGGEEGEGPVSRYTKYLASFPGLPRFLFFGIQLNEILSFNRQLRFPDAHVILLEPH